MFEWEILVSQKMIQWSGMTCGVAIPIPSSVKEVSFTSKRQWQAFIQPESLHAHFLVKSQELGWILSRLHKVYPTSSEQSFVLILLTK